MLGRKVEKKKVIHSMGGGRYRRKGRGKGGLRGERERADGEGKEEGREGG